MHTLEDLSFFFEDFEDNEVEVGLFGEPPFELAEGL